ncbi:MULTISPECIES: cytochrome bd-I oxidase subunit CydX [Pectobacterium]|nr:MULTISPECIES: cytochrome bd-I oxidase subunit CydX [Pectobacterium]GKW10683.1 cyd operon protein YbgT [Pectobacterium carotovorum subsp. carotovorum]MBN3138041.1 cytochrome bd-I oxidase subunit CydX [Pectobacterium punjabense]MBS4429323.1 cytochrome bd-I oxidase subunit CydX [Pectobacterium punjabense]MBT9184812.1 cytochrome bd-I oxidase subunit CydX [Pectobacterium punjabense]MCE5381438.1 cytochrome bd-I oxidase subunit CydX [Pectobacterium punjabense]
MWYFAWILGTLLACAFALVTALAVENHEAGKDASR